jgi:hypothetical protein
MSITVYRRIIIALRRSSTLSTYIHEIRLAGQIKQISINTDIVRTRIRLPPEKDMNAKEFLGNPGRSKPTHWVYPRDVTYSSLLSRMNFLVHMLSNFFLNFEKYLNNKFSNELQVRLKWIIVCPLPHWPGLWSTFIERMLRHLSKTTLRAFRASKSPCRALLCYWFEGGREKESDSWAWDLEWNPSINVRPIMSKLGWHTVPSRCYSSDMRLGERCDVK